MEGNKRITLFDPGPIELNEDGVGVYTEPLVNYKAWAIRRDGSGNERLESDVIIDSSSSRFEVRKTKRLSGISQDWFLVDSDNTVWDISNIQDARFSMGRIHMWIFATKTNRVGPTIQGDPIFFTVGDDTLVVGSDRLFV